MKQITDLISILTDPWMYAVALALFIAITLLVFLFYKRPAFAGKKKHPPLPADSASLPGVSVVLCARNEYENLTELLPLLLEQKYPVFQIVVVNKNSEDNTEILLASLEHFHKNLTIRTLTSDRKFGEDSLMALGIGVRAAIHPYVVFFRPDCRPVSDRWLASLVKTSVERSADTVTGYTSLCKNRLLARYYSMEQQLHQMGMSDLNLPYASTGNNVLFLKKCFLEEQEFNTYTTAFNRCEQAITAHVMQVGKDKQSLEIQSVDASRRFASCTYPEGRVVFTRKLPGKEYRLRHIQRLQTLILTKGWPYVLLILEKTLVAAFYVFLALIFKNAYPWSEPVAWAFPAGLLLLRWITVWVHHAGYRAHLGEKNLVYTAPLWDVFSPVVYFYYLIVLLYKRIKN